MSNPDLLKFLNPVHTEYYITQLFKNVHDLTVDDQIEIRKIGKVVRDGVEKQFDESVSCGMVAQFGEDPEWQKRLAEWVVRRLRLAAEAGHGAFMAPALINDRRANDQSVKQMLSICADFDSGNPEDKIKIMNDCFTFRPSIIVNSGGVTADGYPKKHIHWILKEPCTEPWKVAYIRELIALKFGADTSFKRIPQIIRIPGAMYEKNGNYATTEIVGANESGGINISHFEDILNIDWNNLDPSSMWGQRDTVKTEEQKKERLKQLQHEVITEGGSDTDNRWQRFSEWAGHQIKAARTKLQTVEEARASVHMWVQNNMVPTWPHDRVENEFKNLLGRDQNFHADAWREHSLPPIIAGVDITSPAPKSVAEAGASDADFFDISTFDVGSLYQGNPPAVPYIIENLVIDGAIHALVADGGVGKTYLGLELAMRVASGPDLKNNQFVGFRVLKKTMAVVFTVEDSKDDIHRRLVALDPHGDLRGAAKGGCFVIPVQDQMMGGLTLVERDDRGNMRPSKDWEFIVGKIGECREKTGHAEEPVLIIIDTYSATHHGDENTSMGTNEWFRAASLLRKLNATLWIMHHVKKANPDLEIKTPSDMRNNIRGSIAFVNNCRIVVGIWEMPNSDSVMKELPTEGSDTRLFNMGLLKNNTGIDWSDRSDPRYKEPMITLRRTGSGQLLYDDMIHQTRIEITTNKKAHNATRKAQLKAALVHACRWFGEHAWALTQKQLLRDPERFLPAAVNDAPPKEIKQALTELIKAGSVKELKIKARGGTFEVYDVPEGPYSTDKQTDRVKETPVLPWADFTYDDEHMEYIDRPAAKPVDPDFSIVAQTRMDFTSQND